MHQYKASAGLAYTAINEYECALSGIGTCTDRAIVIPTEHMGRRVIAIADMAFAQNHEITSVYIPATVKAIGAYAFAWCHGFVSVTIENNGVKSIGERCFIGCDTMTSLYLGNAIHSIGEKAFAFCVSLLTLSLPHGTREVGHSAFEGCRSLETAILPDTLDSLPSNMFGACISLTNVSLSAMTKSIGYYAFSYCRNLTDINVGNAMVDDQAFWGCDALAH